MNVNQMVLKRVVFFPLKRRIFFFVRRLGRGGGQGRVGGKSSCLQKGLCIVFLGSRWEGAIGAVFVVRVLVSCWRVAFLGRVGRS